MPPAGFEAAIPASERPQTHALDRAVIGIGTADGDTNMNNSRERRILRLTVDENWHPPHALLCAHAHGPAAVLGELQL